MEVARRDIFLADLNPIVGTEQAGVRPVLVVQIDKANKISSHTIIIPFTTKIKEAILPSHTKIPKRAGGLKEDSVLLCEQIRVIDKRRLIKKIGSFDESYMNGVMKSIRVILGISE
ncbi:MAG: type II toxin-antitoxin system PemK/MazF family toxin [bacterium]|nr:type II toxin-antitoxin system PemK/MazF family toxin [bacterium]